MKKSKLNVPIIILAILIVIAAGTLVFCIFQANKIKNGESSQTKVETTTVVQTTEAAATLIQATEAPVE